MWCRLRGFETSLSGDKLTSMNRQGLGDARSLGKAAGGLDFGEGDVGITPKLALQSRSRALKMEAQTELDSLDYLARRRGIPPGALQGQCDFWCCRQSIQLIEIGLTPPGGLNLVPEKLR
jgi:hypothetical protein